VNLNKVFLIGNLTKDPELRYTPGGDAVLNFVIGTNRRYTTKAGEQKEEASFVGCTAWGKTAENIANYLKKGDPIFVEGRIKQEEYEDKEGKKQTKTKVTVDFMQFVGRKKENPDEPTTTQEAD
jgi:single-strand DNA-binding protein